MMTRLLEWLLSLVKIESRPIEPITEEEIQELLFSGRVK